MLSSNGISIFTSVRYDCEIFITHQILFSVRIEVVVDAVPVAKIDWFCNGELIKPNEKYDISDEANTGVLSIHDVQNNDAGTYILSAKNDCGQITFEVPINVKGKW